MIAIDYQNEGVYSATDAAKLTGVSRSRILRWFRGYRFSTASGNRTMPPVLSRPVIEFDGEVQLSFLDLVEIRYIEGFLKLGVGWKELRKTVEHAAHLMNTKYPFATRRLKTDGRSMFAEIAEDTSLVQLRNWQTVIREVVNPALVGIEFENEQARRWWPLGTRARVVIDPSRAFGRPIGVGSGVPTEILSLHANATTISDAARWYEADTREVRDAVRFQRDLAA